MRHSESTVKEADYSMQSIFCVNEQRSSPNAQMRHEKSAQFTEIVQRSNIR